MKDIKEWRSQESLLQLEKYNYKYQESHDPIFIVKPENACQGKGIFLVRDIKDIENYYQNIGGS